jgi:hypothetical protein
MPQQQQQHCQQQQQQMLQQHQQMLQQQSDQCWHQLQAVIGAITPAVSRLC